MINCPLGEPLDKLIKCALVELRKFFCYFVKCAIFHHVASRSEVVEFLRIKKVSDLMNLEFGELLSRFNEKVHFIADEKCVEWGYIQQKSFWEVEKMESRR